MIIKNTLYRLYQCLPQSIRTEIDIRRRASVWSQYGCIFIHVPKAAGFSVSHALYGRPLGHFRAIDIRRIYPDLFSDLLTFGVVRHPVDRLYSAYRFAKTGGTNEMGMKNPKRYQSGYFTSFDKFVCQWLANQNLNTIDGVFRPQHFYLCSNNEIIVEKVIKLEEIALGMKELTRSLGRNIVLGHHNQSQQLPDTIKSTETWAIIEHVYRKDFEIFSYTLGQEL